MSRLTIIIPLFRETSVDAFEETLASILLHRPEDTDILIANGTEYGDPWSTGADGVNFLSLQTVSNPIEILNIALRCATSRTVVVLWPGAEVTANWCESPLQLLENPKVGIVIPSVFDRRKPRRVFSFGVLYRPEGVLRTIRRSHWPEASDKTIVPHISAVFFRTEAISDSNYFDRTFLPQIAYADLAMTVAEQGWETVVDMNSKIMVRPNSLPATSPFVWGTQTERLYFRWLGENKSFFSLGPHFWSFLRDFGRHFPRFKSFQILSGRLFGLLFFGEMLPFVRRRHKKHQTPELVPTEAPTTTPLSGAEQGQGESRPVRKSA